MNENERIENLVTRITELEKMIAIQEQKEVAQEEKIENNTKSIIQNHREFRKSDEENKKFRNRSLGIVIAINAVYLPVILALIMKYFVG